ncbi:hypothetical protein AB0M79_22110 [Polymorphospora sp. NPDC051019]|uniref:hypothetical protein n=1 Tax=Polymorphospora sp. NPDC051019 TaxID=3155725 RepID=UPI00342B6A56
MRADVFDVSRVGGRIGDRPERHPNPDPIPVAADRNGTRVAVVGGLAVGMPLLVFGAGYAVARWSPPLVGLLLVAVALLVGLIAAAVARAGRETTP